MKAAFWIDAGPAVGGGHVTRAEALGSALRTLGTECVLFAQDVDAVKSAGSGGFRIESLAGQSFADRCRNESPAFAVVDLPHVRPATACALQKLRQHGIPSVCFDASDPTRSVADLVVDAVGGPAARSGRSQRLLGPHYAVLRRSLSGLADRRAYTEQTRNSVVVGFGASDPARLTPLALESLAPLGRRIQVEVLVGPLVDAATLDDIRRRVRRMRHARIHLGVSDPAALLAQADVGVFPFGNLFLEAATTGLACVLWQPTRAHAVVAKQFATRFDGPIALDGGEAWRSGTGWLRNSVRELIGDPMRRRDMGLRVTRQLDGRGSERVARKALALARLPVDASETAHWFQP